MPPKSLSRAKRQSAVKARPVKPSAPKAASGKRVTCDENDPPATAAPASEDTQAHLTCEEAAEVMLLRGKYSMFFCS